MGHTYDENMPGKGVISDHRSHCARKVGGGREGCSCRARSRDSGQCSSEIGRSGELAAE